MTKTLPERVSDWDRRLARVTEKHLSLPGEWGVSDCLLTAADAFEAVTGIDYAAAIRGKYSTEQGAAKLLRRRKCKTVEDALARLFPPTPVLLARRGDAATVERDGTIYSGYVCEYGISMKTLAGLTFVPVTEARSAFQVGAR
ncbi:MAG: hypothetical protein J0I98_14170 [Mesorhizobium sp.]|nr:hypothetical protein [Mesorhizobium sp.]MBN9243933.1 hypothetical protein [Mesorhizobium sp.]